MLEMALATFLVTIAIVAIGGRQRTAGDTTSTLGFGATGDGSDLPCPWCRAQTSESDDHCPSCGQKFG
jgi:hypothetical protein